MRAFVGIPKRFSLGYLKFPIRDLETKQNLLSLLPALRNDKHDTICHLARNRSLQGHMDLQRLARLNRHDDRTQALPPYLFILTNIAEPAIIPMITQLVLEL